MSLSATSSWLWPPRPWLLWNATPSSPVGFYALSSLETVRAGDMVVAWAPPVARRIAAARSYLPLHVPLVKRVAAAGGDQVCAKGGRILINGRLAAIRQRRDPPGRLLPWWSGCARLARGELFLLSAAGPLSFDGRYFGVTRAVELVGKARLLSPKPVQGSGRG